MEYNNPNEPWQHLGYIPHQGDGNMRDRMKSGCLQIVIYLVAVMIVLALCALFGSCTTTKYMPVTQQHTEHHWHTDSVRERDSVHTENSTIIRELDSAAMARYGIQLKNAERAWLVQSREMEMRLRELERMTATRDTVHDSIPAPYPVEVKVPADLTWWQQARLHIANLLLLVLLIIALWESASWLRRTNK